MLSLDGMFLDIVRLDSMLLPAFLLFLFGISGLTEPSARKRSPNHEYLPFDFSWIVAYCAVSTQGIVA
jgi:hypothetical protein